MITKITKGKHIDLLLSFRVPRALHGYIGVTCAFCIAEVATWKQAEVLNIHAAGAQGDSRRALARLARRIEIKKTIDRCLRMLAICLTSGCIPAKCNIVAGWLSASRPPHNRVP